MSEFDNKYAEVLSHFTEPDVPLKPDALLDDESTSQNPKEKAQNISDAEIRTVEDTVAADETVIEDSTNEKPNEELQVKEEEQKPPETETVKTTPEETEDNYLTADDGEKIIFSPLEPETEANVMKRPRKKLPWKKIAVCTAAVAVAVSVLICIPKPQKEEKINLFTDSMVSFAKTDSESLMNLYGVVNKRGKTVIKPLYSMTFLPGEDVILAAEGSESVTFYTGSGAKLALVNKKGDKITDFVFDDTAGKFSQKLMAASKNDKWGYIDKKGTWQIKAKYADAYNFSEGLAAVRNTKNLKWGFINKKGEKVVDFSFQEAGEFKNGTAPVKLNDKWGYIDDKGNFVIKNKFADIGTFETGIAMAQNTKGKWGYINKKGEWIVKPVFEDLHGFSDSLCAAKKDGKWGYINKKGDFVIKNVYSFAGDFNDSMAYVSKKDNGGFYYINKKGETKIKGNYESASDFVSGVALIKTKKGFGYINKKGEKITKDKFSIATSFFDDGYAIVCEPYKKSPSGEKWYIINRRGKKIFKRTFDGM